jgi:DNA-binding transcriptional ArsR family regulator
LQQSRPYFDISKNIVDIGNFYVYYYHVEHEDAAKRLSELGNTTRLAIFRYLVKVGPDGVPVGQIQKALGIPGSTLSHHIARLMSVGLIKQDRASRTLYCTAQYAALRELIDFLQSECCIGIAECD